MSKRKEKNDGGRKDGTVDHIGRSFAEEAGTARWATPTSGYRPWTGGEDPGARQQRLQLRQCSSNRRSIHCATHCESGKTENIVCSVRRRSEEPLRRSDARPHRSHCVRGR
ncbi:hypothetical protein TNIN_295061 [Trichonephila inaurata madagascariensis]|uniref:Uncharacterized protein n=1 Tax=Trichonephila inaurata madagascariensis TaxID=2747483 RepID=A0A8X6IWV5_9ARAC|nr:hypothetical protein TNIN_295061 [Trichonephila inaurata madagascariensis]